MKKIIAKIVVSVACLAFSMLVLWFMFHCLGIELFAVSTLKAILVICFFVIGGAIITSFLGAAVSVWTCNGDDDDEA